MPAAFPRWTAIAALLAVFGTLPVVRAQPASGTYGVELRGAGDGSRIEARVGPNTAQAETRRTALVVPRSPQPFTVKWSAREVSVTIGGQSVRYPATWRIGNAVRISARGSVRASIAVVGGRRVDKIITGTPTADGKSELIVSGAYLTKNWTLDGAIDWPDEPTPGDTVMVTTTSQDPATVVEDPKNRQSFTGGVADPLVLSPPSGIQRRSSLTAAPAVTLTWIGGVVGAASKSWSNAANWDPQRVPVAGDVVEFGTRGKEKAPVNDGSDPPLGGIIVSDRSYELNEKGLTLAPNSVSQINEEFRVDSLEGGGTINIGGGTVLTVGPRNGTPAKPTTTFTGTLNGANGAELFKDGSGTFIFAGVTNTVQLVTVNDGAFVLANGARVEALSVENRAVGFGVLPGTASSGNFTIDNADYLETIGPEGHGLLNVTGSVRISHLGSTTLRVSVAAGYTPPVGTPIIIIQNDGTDAVVDSPNDVFRDTNNNRLNEGDTFIVNGVTFRMSYRCNAERNPAACDGTGNDVGFTAISTPEPVTRPDLTITKTRTGNFTQGQSNATYTITVTNSGQAQTIGAVTVTDLLPTGLTATALSGPSWGCTLATLTCTRGDALAAGASFPPLTLTANVSTTAPASVTNTATVSGGGETRTDNNTATDVAVIGTGADLTIDKAHTGSFTRGQTGTYTITVRNAGASSTTGTVTVTDTLPTGLTATILSGSGWSCTLGTLTCTRTEAIAAGASAPPLTLTVNVAATAPATVTNTAAVSGGGDINLTNNSDADPTTIGGEPDLIIEKTHTGTFTRGQTGTYTITVRNIGGVGSSGTITVTDTLPGGLTATAFSGTNWTCAALTTLSCTNAGPIAAGGSAPALTLTVSVAATAPASVNNTATVSGGGESNTTNNTATDVATIGGGPDLTITKSHAGNFTQGQTGATYTITVTNSGTAATNGAITVSDALPTGLTATAFAGTGWTCTVSPLSCTNPGPIAAGASAPLTLTVNVAADASAGVTNTATVSGGGETNTTNNTATDATAIGAGPDLTIAKTHAGSFTRGQTGATYTITVANAGGAVTTAGVSVADVLPGSLTATAFAGTGWTCDLAPVLLCRRDPLGAGVTAPPLTLTVNVAADAPASVVNIAKVAGGNETNAANNTALDVTTIGAGADLTITKTQTASFTQGQTGATYTITVTNSGGAATTGTITVADALPAGLTATAFAGAGWTCTVTPLSCTHPGPISAGASAPPLTLTVTVAANAPATVTNTATVSGGGDVNADNNTATSSATIGAGPDLTIAKTQTGSFTQGQIGATYTITVTNSGGAATTGTITVTDALPTGLTATAFAGAGWTCGLAPLSCTQPGPIGAGASAPPLTLTVTVAANAPATVTNTATVSGGGDVNTTNNTATNITTIGAGPDLTIAKTHTGNFSPGQIGATYTITVTNSGNSPTSSPVTVTDALPTGLTATAFAGAAGWTCDPLPALSCTHSGAIAAGTAAPALTLTVNVAPDATGTLTNTATVAGGGDVNTGNNSATDSTRIGAGPDLTITKTHTGNFSQGQIGATYTITVSNIGGAPTTAGISVADLLPNSLTATAFAGPGWTCDLLPAAICRRSDPLGAGTTAPLLTLTVNVAADAPASVTNIAKVAGGNETNAANNTTFDVTTIGTGPDLIVTKTHSGNFSQGQTGATYTITVKNAGAVATTGTVTVTDSLPGGLTPTAFAGQGWTCTVAPLLCTHAGSIAAGAEAPALTLTVNVAPNATGTLTNTATVAGGGDVNAGNNTATDSTTIGAGPDLTIAKTHAGNFSQGQTGATYTITVRNAGGEATTGAITVTDALPSGLTPTSFAGSGWACNPLPALSCTRSDAIGVGASAPLTLTVNVAPNAAATLTNTATVAGGGDVNASNNTATDPTTISAGPDLTITKTHTGNFTQGQTGAIYTITVTNAGSTPTSGPVTVTDTLPAGLTATAFAGGADWICDPLPALSCTHNGAIAAGAAEPPLTLTVNVAPNAAATLTNTATVAGGGDVNTANNTATNPTTIGAGPDLTINKTHTGDFTQGQIGATYTIKVTNTVNAPTGVPVTVTDTLPTAMTATALSGPGWSCTLATLTCTHDAVPAGGTFPDLTLTVNVANNAGASLINTATVAGGGDVNMANNTVTDVTNVIPALPDLTVTKKHDGDFFVGQQGATYKITVTNAGNSPTSLPVTLIDTLPAGVTATAVAGSGWTCDPLPALSCTHSGAIAAGASAPEVTLTVNVAINAAGVVTNTATVSGGGETNTTNNTATDPTTIQGRPQLTIIKSHPDPVIQGEHGLPFGLLVSNNGTGPTTGTVTVTDTLPAGLTLVDASGSGWSCSIAAATVTCSRSSVLAQAESYPPIQIRADVAADAISTVNEATVSGGGDTTPNDNVARDHVPISAAGQPNLVMTKEHDGNFTQGQQGAAYRLSVTNSGQAPTTGLVTVTDNLPAGLTPTSASGSGWACTIGSQAVTCTRSDALAPGAGYPLVVILVNVAANATNLVNIAMLTGGGDQTAVDNVSTDGTQIAARAPDLSVTKRHVDPFLAGQQGASYHITVTNTGTAPTTGEVIVVDNLPAGLTPVSGSGSGWSCAVAGRTLTCRRSDSLAPGASFPDITLLVNVEPNASNLTNVVSVSGGGDATPDNNTDADNTSINVSPDPTISLSRSTTLVVSEDAEYQVVVTNLGPGLLGGKTDVETVLPAELAPLSALGDGWSCSTDGQRIHCSRIGQCLPNNAFSTIRIRAFVRQGPTPVTVTAKVANTADSNLNNNVAVNTSDSVLPASSISIVKKTTTPRVEIGGVAGYEIEVTNTGEAILLNAVVHDRLPRGFVLVKSSAALRSATRTRQTGPSDAGNGNIDWPIESLAPSETVTLLYGAIVGADARSGLQDNRATVDATGPLNATITAGPAIATVEVTTSAFTMLQSLVGRVFEDVDGNGMFGGGDRPIANARVITSTGQAALTDPAGMYNIPSIGSGTVAVSLDRDTIPSGLTTIDGPGGRSWTRMLRTPIGGGTLLTQNFPLARAAAAAAGTAVPTTPPDAADINRVPDDPQAGSIPPRRDYETRQGSSLFIGLGEVSFGRAAQEFELFQKDKDVWGYGSVFYQGPLVSAKNRLTFAVDSRRHLNGTTDQDRLFELDPNDRMYPVFGDSSVRQEFATANSKVFARVERGTSHVMWGDLIGDLPSSASDGGRWSSYQRHLTGVELRLADKAGDHVTVRGAQPKTAYARDVFAGGTLGLMTLSHTEVLAGTETIALEVRDRRMPDRLLERDVLARGVDYQLEPGSGTVFLQRNVTGIDPQLNLVQIVATYEYENQGLDHMVFNGRAAGTYKSVHGGVTFFTEEGLNDTRFTVFGLDFAQSLPRGGRWRLDLPFSHGTPNVASSVDSRPVSAGADTDGFAIQGEVEQPFAFWSGVLHASFLHADDNFSNPFSATITPGAGYFNANAALVPRKPSRVTFGVTYERYNTTIVDASRTTLSAEWAETIGQKLTLKAGYDGRSLDQSGSDLDSGLFTGQAIVKVGDRFEARAAREQNVRDDTDPTYPDQTLLGARWKMTKDTSLFYTQRISDSAIVPIGDFATTGFSQLNTKGELNVGVESHVQDSTQLTSGYRVEQGINGPDAYATIGVLTHVKLGHDLGTSFGLEHGQLVSGPDQSYTSGSLAVDWLPSNRFKATTRYEARDRGGYESLFTAGAAARLYAGFTGLTRIEWTSSDHTSIGDAKAFLAALALRPLTNDRVGWLLSYQYVDGGASLPTVAPGRASTAWQHLLSTDGYLQPLHWLELHGKFAWQRTDPALGLVTDTYLSQFRAQVMLSKRFDGALEQRYIWQPTTDSHRNGTALEIGVWPIADARVAVGYNFNDSRDPYGRDLQGRDKGVYLTLSTKLSYLFDLFGSKPPAAVPR